MSQCEKILPDGERCSNSAVPGTAFCRRCRPIRFRPVAEDDGRVVRLNPEPVQPETSKGDEGPVVVPAAPAGDPVFPGLRRDERGILTGPEAALWLPLGAETDGRPGRLLAALSEATPLEGTVSVFRAPDGLLFRAVAPKESDDSSPEAARFFEAVDAVAARTGGVPLVGGDAGFVRYRDARAPRGYDAEAPVEVPPGVLLLAGPDGVLWLDRNALTPLPPADLILAMRPVSRPESEPPAEVFMLTDAALYRIVAPYLRAHRLSLRAARLTGSNGDRVLLEARPEADAPSGPRVPAFVMEWLDSLPRCVPLIPSAANGDRRLLTAWGHRCPGRADRLLAVFPEDSLATLVPARAGENLLAAPAPVLLADTALADPEVPAAPVRMVSPSKDGLGMAVPIRIVRDTGPIPLTAALILDDREREWLRRLLYRFPESAFEGCRLLAGGERSILLGDERGLPGFPFGIPLRRVRDTPLFIPLRARLAPSLSWPILAQALEITQGRMAFLLPDLRLYADERTFRPLSESVIPDPDRPEMTLEIHPAEKFPPLEWDTPPAVEIESDDSEAAAPSEETGRSFLDRLLGRRKASPVPSKPEPEPVQDTPPPEPNSSEPNSGIGQLPATSEALPPETLFQEQAKKFQEDGDLLAAAICFALAGAETESARGFREAARVLRDAQTSSSSASPSFSEGGAEPE